MNYQREEPNSLHQTLLQWGALHSDAPLVAMDRLLDLAQCTGIDVFVWQQGWNGWVQQWRLQFRQLHRCEPTKADWRSVVDAQWTAFMVAVGGKEV